MILFSELSKRYQAYYADFPKSVRWRLFVDGIKQVNAHDYQETGFEAREPGHLQAMENAFQFLLSTPGETITVDYIQKLHTIAATGVQFTSNRGRNIKHVKPGEFYPRHSNLYDGVLLHLTSNASNAGIQELIESVAQGSGLTLTIPHPNQNTGQITIDQTWLSHYGADEAYRMLAIHSFSSIRVCTALSSPRDIEKKLSNIISQYQSEMSQKPISSKEKLRVIVSFIRQLGWLHPFKDANTRVFVMLLLNKCLIENNFPPTLLNNPNVFDGHSIEELIDQVCQGFHHFKVVKDYGRFLNFNKRTFKAKL